MNENPWLSIPLADYEGHMEAVGQTAALRRLFSEIYQRLRPKRLAVLGCTAGADFEYLDPTITEVAVGVDINPRYLAAAEQRLTALGRRVHFVCGDVLRVTLPHGPFDLIHAALLIEYIDATALFDRVRAWLCIDGFFSVISQEPLLGIAAVSKTSYESLQSLSSSMSLKPAGEIERIGRQKGFVLKSRQSLELPNGKVFVHSVFGVAGSP